MRRGFLMLAHVILLNSFGRYSIQWALMTRKLLHYLEHTHVGDQGLTGVAAESQKQNMLIQHIKCHKQGTQLQSVAYVKRLRCIEIITDLSVFYITSAVDPSCVLGGPA